MTDAQNKARIDELLAQAITEAVCAQFRDFYGFGGQVSAGLRADVYARVLKILTEGVDV